MSNHYVEASAPGDAHQSINLIKAREVHRNKLRKTVPNLSRVVAYDRSLVSVFLSSRIPFGRAPDLHLGRPLGQEGVAPKGEGFSRPNFYVSLAFRRNEIRQTASSLQFSPVISPFRENFGKCIIYLWHDSILDALKHEHQYLRANQQEKEPTPPLPPVRRSKPEGGTYSFSGI